MTVDKVDPPKIHVVPNVVNAGQQVHVEVDTATITDILTVTNIFGRVLYTILTPGSGSYLIGSEQFEKGLYFINLVNHRKVLAKTGLIIH